MATVRGQRLRPRSVANIYLQLTDMWTTAKHKTSHQQSGAGRSSTLAIPATKGYPDGYPVRSH
jgi:hypothetical protein